MCQNKYIYLPTLNIGIWIQLLHQNSVTYFCITPPLDVDGMQILACRYVVIYPLASQYSLSQVGRICYLI